MENKIYKTFEIESILELVSMWSDESDQIGSKVEDKVGKDLLEDIDVGENEVDFEIAKKIKRYQIIVNKLKEKYNYKCQICGHTFSMDNGKKYCEAHHIKMLSKDGTQNPENVIIVCANHHRMFHYATETTQIGELVDGKRELLINGHKIIICFK